MVIESLSLDKAVKIAEITPMKEIVSIKEYSKWIIEPDIDIAKNNSLESISQMNDEKGFERITTRNQELEGGNHPDTGVPFEAKIVENSKLVEGVFPKFDSIYDAQLPEKLLKATDYEQFSECNRQLKEAVQNNPELKDKFIDEQLDQIMNGETPDGCTWHHDAEKGRMPLVDAKIHAQTGHTGGRVIWGIGSINR